MIFLGRILAYDIVVVRVWVFNLSKPGSTRPTILTTATVSVVEETPKGDLLVQTCGICGNEVILDAGDVTFGGEWYHAACWQLAKLGASQEKNRAAPKK